MNNRNQQEFDETTFILLTVFVVIALLTLGCAHSTPVRKPWIYGPIPPPTVVEAERSHQK